MGIRDERAGEKTKGWVLHEGFGGRNYTVLLYKANCSYISSRLEFCLHMLNKLGDRT